VTSTDPLEHLQDALSAHYRVVRELGRGGMSTVYLAIDLKHQRSVALKVLHADLAAYLGPERFRREIAIAAKLHHPHILTVLDSGETSTGELWFTMPYVEGESLADRIRRQRQLPLDDALRIAREVALALDYAHRQGFIHRDVKPENILLVDGHATVADFGIARAFGSNAMPNNTLTEPGTAMGTPAYMSPEQVVGERSLDATTDIYSLGVVVYEMLAGELPFTGPTAQAIASKMMAGNPPSLRSSRPTVPVAVDAAVLKALALVPADRFATAVLFASALDNANRAGSVAPDAEPARAQSAPARALRPVFVALAAIPVVAAASYFAWRIRERVDASPVAIAVLPFENLGDSGDAYFADGMTDAVRGRLASMAGLRVTAPISSTRYRSTTETPQQIGRELGVRYLLMGRVRWLKSPGGPSRVQVTPALVEAGTAADKWDAPFDAPLTDVFQVQADIASRVADALQLSLTPTAQRALANRPTNSLAAYDAYLRARALINERGGDYDALETEAIPALHDAIRQDSSFALAWATLAEVQLTVAGSPTDQAAEFAEAGRAALRRALELAPDLPEARAEEGYYDFAVLGDAKRALTDYQSGLRVAPDNPLLLSRVAAPEWFLGRYDSSLTHTESAARLDPANADVLDYLCLAYAAFHRFGDAERACDRALAIQPSNVATAEYRVLVSLEQGDTAGAKAVVHALPTTLDQTYVAEFLAGYYELGWILDSAQERLLLDHKGPTPLETSTLMCAIAQQYGFRGDSARARVYAESAHVAYARQLRSVAQNGRTMPPPAIAQLHAFDALSLGYAHRSDSAMAHIKLAEAAEGGRDPYIEFLASKVYLLLDKPDLALDILERGVAHPQGEQLGGDLGFFFTPGWLRVDPNFARLRGNPRFQHVIAQPMTPGQLVG
jgi:serine/threonine-protein kinase